MAYNVKARIFSMEGSSHVLGHSASVHLILKIVKCFIFSPIFLLGQENLFAVTPLSQETVQFKKKFSKISV